MAARDERDPGEQEAIDNLAAARRTLEDLEDRHFMVPEGSPRWVTREEVEDARDDYMDAWEARRDYTLERKSPNYRDREDTFA